MEYQISIYALCEPGTGIVRYIGQSVNVSQRYQFHIHSLGAVETPCKRWILQLKQQGLKPTLKVLEVLPPDTPGGEAEDKWIHFYLGQGADLTNLHYTGSKKKKAG